MTPNPLEDAVRRAELPEPEWETFDKIEPRSIRWADKPLWQHDAYHALVGRKGVGKGTILADWAARVTRGEFGEKRNVIWIGSEDSFSIDVVPRTIAAGAEQPRLVRVKRWVKLPEDFDWLQSLVTKIGEVGAVIIDPVANHSGGRDSNREEIREVIGPLNDFADRNELMLVGTRHLSEKELRSGILAGILGSSAWVQVPRAVIAAVRDDEDPELTHLQVVANNRLPPGTQGRLYRIEGVQLDGHEGDVTRAVCLGESGKDVNGLTGAETPSPSKSAQARELILDKLEAAPAMRLEADAFDAAVAAETGLAARTVRNLRAKLKDGGLIRPVPDKDDSGKVERWWIERTHAPRPENPLHGVSRNPAPDGQNPVQKSSALDVLSPSSAPAHALVCQGSGSNGDSSGSALDDKPGWLLRSLEDA